MAKAKKKALAKRKTILPRKMSKLIEIAMKDLKRVEAAKDMVVVMEEWFDPEAEVVCKVGGNIISERQVCSACLAGSVMAFTLGKKNAKSYLIPDDMRGNEDQLNALNELRCGGVSTAAEVLGLVERGDYNKMGQFAYSPERQKIIDELDCEIPDYDNQGELYT